MEQRADALVGVRVSIGAMPEGFEAAAHARGLWKLVARDRDGNVIAEREWENLVTTEGKNHMLGVTLDGQAQDTTWFVGLTDGTPTVAAGDTLASHAGWVEVTAYTGTRQAAVFGTAGSGSLDNSASPAAFPITSDSTTIGGAFLASVTSGTSGVLYAAGAFSGGDLVLNNGSSLNITCTFTL
jgi:hypothetical protein